MKIGVACTHYNGLEGLKVMISSVIDRVDEIIINDGAWKGFEDEGLSNDGSREYIKQFQKIHLIDNPGLMPNEKQTRHMEYAGKLGIDVLILIDDDEYMLEFDRELFELSLSHTLRKDQYVYYCDFVDFNYSWQTFQYPRIIYKPEKCSYPYRHNQIYANGTPQINSKKGLVVKGIKLKHDKKTRTGERENYNRNWNESNPRH